MKRQEEERFSRITKRHGLKPTALKKSTEKIMKSTQVSDGDEDVEYSLDTQSALAADPVVKSMSDEQMERTIKYTRKKWRRQQKNMTSLKLHAYVTNYSL